MLTRLCSCANCNVRRLHSVQIYFLLFATVEDMIKEVDVDGDGRIDFYEFVRALGEPEDSDDLDEEDAEEEEEQLCYEQDEQFSQLPVPVTPKSFTANYNDTDDDDDDDD